MKCFQFCIYFICLIPISGTKSRTLARIRPAVLATRAPFSGVLCSKRKDHFLYYYLETHIILLFQVVGVERMIVMSQTSLIEGMLMLAKRPGNVTNVVQEMF